MNYEWRGTHTVLYEFTIYDLRFTIARRAYGICRFFRSDGTDAYDN